MNRLIESLFEPTVLAALAAGIMALMAPRLAERAKRRANGVIERARQDTTLVGAAERLTRELIERLTAEVTELQKRTRQIEIRDSELRACLYGVLDDLRDLKTILDRPHRPATSEELDEKRMEIELRVRRGIALWDDVA